MFERTAIAKVFLFTPKRIEDTRGFFAETFKRATLEVMTGPIEWLQDNHSRSVEVGVVRGRHFQIPPFAQDKLVRCIRGALLDVVLDIRKGSPTFGRAVTAVLSKVNGAQIFVPKGFGHGFAVLEPNAEVIYKSRNRSSTVAESGLL